MRVSLEVVEGGVSGSSIECRAFEAIFRMSSIERLFRVRSNHSGLGSRSLLPLTSVVLLELGVSVGAWSNVRENAMPRPFGDCGGLMELLFPLGLLEMCVLALARLLRTDELSELCDPRFRGVVFVLRGSSSSIGDDDIDLLCVEVRLSLEERDFVGVDLWVAVLGLWEDPGRWEDIGLLVVLRDDVLV